MLRRALADKERGLGRYDVQITAEALDHLATISDGDARRALTALEVGVLSQHRKAGAKKKIVYDLTVAQESIQAKAIQYDRAGEMHYDAASAFIKSMRGSDPDATVYWLARMLEAGEDPRFIARRIAILASEDIGNADPRAISVAAAAFDIAERIGMPECRITLAQAAIYMACAPKSNASYAAIDAALDDVRNQPHAAGPAPPPQRPPPRHGGAVRLRARLPVQPRPSRGRQPRPGLPRRGQDLLHPQRPRLREAHRRLPGIRPPPAAQGPPRPGQADRLTGRVADRPTHCSFVQAPRQSAGVTGVFSLAFGWGLLPQ